MASSTKDEQKKRDQKQADGGSGQGRPKQQKQQKQPKQQRQRKPGELSRFQKIVIVVFIVIFALSTLAGALASVVQTQNAEDASSESQETTVADVDADYEAIVSELESKVAENAEDKASLLALGSYYSQWGSRVSSLASTDDETTHANELYDKAIGYYDQYLALEDSPAARVNRALCLYYKGDSDGALSGLQEVTTASPDYAPGWANLGMLYEILGQTDDARAAYEQAEQADPDDEYGAKTYAEQRISSLDQAAEDAATDDGSTDDAATTDDGSADSGDAADTTSTD